MAPIMAVSKTRSAKIDVGGTRVTINSGFELECECGKELNWCKHRSNVLSLQIDIDPIRSFLLDKLNQDVKVPLIPSRNLFAVVHLEPHGAYHHVLISDIDNSSEAMHFLGIFAPGDSLVVLRGMVFEWFRGMSHTKLECSSAGHSYKAQMQVDSILREKIPSDLFEYYWTVYSTKNCLWCHRQNQTKFDFDDLIPEDERRVSPWKSRL